MKLVLVAVFLNGAMLGGLVARVTTPAPQRPCLLYYVQSKDYNGERPKNMYQSCDGETSAVSLQLAPNTYVWMEVGP